MVTIARIALILFGFMISSPVRAEDVTVGTSIFPPYERMEDGKAVGPGVEMVRRVLTGAGMTPHILVEPYRRIWSELLDGQIDIWPNALLPDLVDQVVASDQFARIGVSVAWHPGTPPKAKATQLAGESIITFFGYTYLGLLTNLAALDPAPSFVEINDVAQVPKLLDAGRARYVLVYDTMLGDPALSQGQKWERLPMLHADFHYLILKTHPHAAEMIERINQSLRALPADQRLPDLIE